MINLLDNSWFHRAILLLISVMILNVGLNLPFVNINDVETVRYATYAKKISEVGLFEAKFGLIEAQLDKPLSGYIYNTFQLPLWPILLSGFYKLFGVSEAITRMMSMIVMVILILGVYQLGMIAKNKWMGFVGALFMIVTPVFQIYGKMSLPVLLVVALSTWLIWAYFRWLNILIMENRWLNKYYFLILFLSIFCGLTDWIGMIVPIVLLIHSHLYFKTGLKYLWILILVSGILLGIHSIHVYFLTGIGINQGLWLKIFSPAGINPELLPELKKFSLFRFIGSEFSLAGQMIPVMLIMVIMSWFVIAIKYWWDKDTLTWRQQIGFVLFLQGILMIVLFPKTIFRFDYFHILFLPFIAFSSGFVIVKIINILKLSEIANVLLVFSLISVTAYGGLNARRVEAADVTMQTAYEMTQMINREFKSDKKIIIDMPESDYRIIKIVDFYAKNKIIFSDLPIEVWEKNKKQIVDGYDSMIIVDTVSPNRNVINFLNNSFEMKRYGIFRVYQLQ